MLKLKNNEDGVVFVTVLILVISMMILAVSVVNVQLNQATISEKEIHRVRCETLTQGLLMNFIANGPSSNTAVTLNGVVYTLTLSLTDDNSGPGGTDPLVIDCDY